MSEIIQTAQGLEVVVVYLDPRVVGFPHDGIKGSLLLYKAPDGSGTLLSAGSSDDDTDWVVDSGQFSPPRTLFVATSWPADADADRCFTDIASAITQAIELVPTVFTPVGIHVYPGRYVGDVTLPSFVQLFGFSQAAAIIQGDVFHSPVGSGSENLSVNFIRINGNITIDCSGKTGGGASIVLKDVVHFGDLTGIGQAGGGADLVSVFSSVTGVGVTTFTDIQVSFMGTRYSGCVFNGACSFQLDGGQNQPSATDAHEVNGTSSGEVAGLTCTVGWTLDDTASVVFSGCTFTENGDGPADLTVGATATADIRSSAIPDAQLFGPGAVLRRSQTASPAITVAGANAVLFTVPFPDGDYNVALQLTAGPGNAATTITAKTGSGFTINDSVGGNTFDAVITHS